MHASEGPKGAHTYPCVLHIVFSSSNMMVSILLVTAAQSMSRHPYPCTRYILRLDTEEFDVEVEGGVGRDDAPCSTAAVPQLRRHRDLTPLADLRSRAGKAIEAGIQTDIEVCSVTSK